MSEFNVVGNTVLVELVERGLRKGYWDKALIPELKKRFEKAQKQEKLLGLYQKLYHDYDDLTMNEEIDIQKQIKELENE